MKRDTIISSKRVENLLYYVLMGAILLTVFTRCSDGGRVNESPEIGAKKIIAAYKLPTGGMDIGIILRVISKEVRTDSVTKKDAIVVDTLFGRPVTVPMVDSTGTPRLDSLGKPLLTVAYFPIGKDSVNWRVENISVDSLLKKLE